MSDSSLARADALTPHPAIDSAPPCVRPVAEVSADIAAAIVRLAALRAERKTAWRHRDAGIVADFDNAIDRHESAARWGVTFTYVGVILFRAGRRTREYARRGA